MSYTWRPIDPTWDEPVTLCAHCDENIIGQHFSAEGCCNRPICEACNEKMLMEAAEGEEEQ